MAPENSPGDSAVLSVPIEELALPVRAYNRLRREGVHTVGDLVTKTPEQLLAIDNIGPASIEEIRQRLADRGLALREGGPFQESLTADELASSADAASPDEVPAPADAASPVASPTDAAPGAEKASPPDATAGQGKREAALRIGFRPLNASPDDEPVTVVAVPRRALPLVAGVAGLVVLLLGVRRLRSRR